jgi:methionyl-tRNA formyltransferase
MSFFSPLFEVDDSNFQRRAFIAPRPKARVAVFGSFYGGYHVLKELLEPSLSQWIEVVGVATDDPTQAFTNPGVRLWKHPHTVDEELLVPRFSAAHDLPVYSGRVKSASFATMFTEHWRPDLCLMATFGQKIPVHIFERPRLGFYNFHHSDEVWPSYPGPDPIRDMVRDGKTEVVITLHEVSAVIDDGAAFARSHKVRLPPAANAVKVHRITWPQMGPFIRNQLLTLLRIDEDPLSTHDSEMQSVEGLAKTLLPNQRAQPLGLNARI